MATDDPLVIEKKDGKLGTFYRFKGKKIAFVVLKLIITNPIVAYC
jgi:hypothetical protein